MTGILIAIFGLGLVIFIHELGHFFTGKLFKLKITEFFIGLPVGRSLWQFKRGETVYGVKLVLLGGYVKFPEFLDLQDLEIDYVAAVSPAKEAGLKQKDKILAINGKSVANFKDVLELTAAKPGETVKITVLRAGAELELKVKLGEKEGKGYLGVGPKASDKITIEDYPKTLEGQPFWRHSLIVASGPLMNILIALLLVFAVMKVGLKQPTNVVAQVVPKSPAAQVGIKANDRVVSIAGKKTTSWSQVMKTIQAHAGQKVTVKVRRDGKTLTFQVKLRQKPNKKGLLGIVTKLKRQSLSTVAALKEALNFMTTATVLIFQFLGKLVSAPSQVAGQLRSPIGVVQETAPIAQRDLLEYLITLAGISLAVGIFNVLPLPPLDGGRLALAAIEAVRRRPFTKETAIAINVIGLAILLTLMTYVIVADISRIAVNSG